MLTVDSGADLSNVEATISTFLQEVLDQTAPGLKISGGKTKAATFRDDKQPMVLQSRKMERIQAGISGGFDAIAGQEILDAIQGLIRSQQRYSERHAEEQEWPFSPVADVRDATVARFAAGRFRSTYRSLRPLLEDGEHRPETDTPSDDHLNRGRMRRSQSDLDDEARTFALALIESWIDDPSNVRLLRIGLDVWPAEDILNNVLSLLKPFTGKGTGRLAARRVAWYCLAEIFRAGATETGFVRQDEALPAQINIAGYRLILWQEAVRLAALPPSRLPWYLKQQVALFLAVNCAERAEVVPTIRGSETGRHRRLIIFLRGETQSIKGTELATLAILSRRAFRDSLLRFNYWMAQSIPGTSHISPSEIHRLHSKYCQKNPPSLPIFRPMSAVPFVWGPPSPEGWLSSLASEE